MFRQSEIITSHRSRVKRAEEYRKNLPEKISVLDRKAFVEYYLLEDMVRLYEHRLNSEQNQQVCTQEAEILKRFNITVFSDTIKIFRFAVEVANSLINLGDYKMVRRAIHERPLKSVARTGKISKAYKLGVEVLQSLLKGLPSDAEIESINKLVQKYEELN